MLQDVQKPAPEGWPNALDTMQAAHQLAKASNKALLELRELADKHDDYDFGNFLEGAFQIFCIGSIPTLVVTSIFFSLLTLINIYESRVLFTEHFLHKQTELIKTMSDHITNLRRVGHGLGEYQFDKETME